MQDDYETVVRLVEAKIREHEENYLGQQERQFAEEPPAQVRFAFCGLGAMPCNAMHPYIHVACLPACLPGRSRRLAV